MTTLELTTQIKKIPHFHLRDLATLINYTEVFDDKIEITVAENAYELQDHYCKIKDCDCANNCSDTRFSVYENGEKVGEFGYNYKKAALTKPSEYSYLIDKIKFDKKDFDDLLGLRHTLVKKAFEFFQMKEKSVHLKQRTIRLKNQIKELKKVVKKIGRNEPCPCGSGKKYKKCCL